MRGVGSARPDVRPLSLTRLVVWAIRVAGVTLLVWGAAGSLASGRLTASAWQNLVLFGIAQGSVYALIALGYTMVYGTLGFINFAHGDVFMTGTMAAYFTARALAADGLWYSSPFLSLLLVLVAAMTVSTLVAVVLERAAYRPLRSSPRLVLLVTSVGASFVIQYSVAGLFSPGVKELPEAAFLSRHWEVLGFRVFAYQLLAIGSAAAMLAGLYWLIERSRTGRSIRAIGEDKEAAALMGINVDRTITLTFAVGGAMAGAGAFVYSLLFPQVYFLTGFLPGIKAFTAAVLGGIGNIAGAMLGGVLLGIIEAVGPGLVLAGLGIPSPHQLHDVLAFSILVFVLVFRPTGLLGERLGEEHR